jgi:hypothetical protein
MTRTAKYRRHSTYEPAQPAETAHWALFAGKMRAKLKPSGQRADRVESAQHFSMIHSGPTFGNTLAHTERPSGHGVPGADRGQYGSELRSQDLSCCRIRRIKAVELGGIRRPETAREEVAPAKFHLVHLRSPTWHDVDSLLGTAGFEPATSTVTVNQKPVNIRN